jgi:hypothetical protein
VFHLYTAPFDVVSVLSVSVRLVQILLLINVAVKKKKNSFSSFKHHINLAL